MTHCFSKITLVIIRENKNKNSKKSRLGRVLQKLAQIEHISIFPINLISIVNLTVYLSRNNEISHKMIILPSCAEELRTAKQNAHRSQNSFACFPSEIVAVKIAHKFTSKIEKILSAVFGTS